MTSTWDDKALTRDAFLGGRLQIWQPRHGYRAGVDPVLLAATIPAKQQDRILELGCGVGVASLCLAHRTGATVTGLEMLQDYAGLARRNAQDNGIEFDVTTGDLRDMPTQLRSQSFDQVIANPPYYDRARGTKAPDPRRETALGEVASLAEWMDAAVRRLKSKGYVTFIQKADRLPQLLAAIDQRLGDVSVLPMAARSGRSEELCIVRARKAARGAFRLLAPVILHNGDRHLADKDSYRPDVQAALRDAASLEVDW